MKFIEYWQIRLIVLGILMGLIAGCGDTQNSIVDTYPEETQNTEMIYLAFAPAAPNASGGAAIGEIASIDNVYDGDTIKDVKFLVCNPCELRNPILPINQEENKIYFVSDIRIKGIDTPELRPSKAERTEVSLNREKALATQARDYLRHLLANADSITIENQEEDKYYGRIVADVIVRKDGQTTNIGDKMIECGYAVAYDGGTKSMDWGAEGITPTCIAPVNPVDSDIDLMPQNNNPQDNNNRVVYKTKTGAKYHHEGCPHLRQSAIPVTIAEAEASGLSPCNLFQ